MWSDKLSHWLCPCPQLLELVRMVPWVLSGTSSPSDNAHVQKSAWVRTGASRPMAADSGFGRQESMSGAGLGALPAQWPYNKWSTSQRQQRHGLRVCPATLDPLLHTDLTSHRSATVTIPMSGVTSGWCGVTQHGERSSLTAMSQARVLPVTTRSQAALWSQWARAEVVWQH